MVGSLIGKYKAYRNHPQTLRFENRVEELYFRHEEQVAEMLRRGYVHNSALPKSTQPYRCSEEEILHDRADLRGRQAAKKFKV
jgi:hypothetical protein